MGNFNYLTLQIFVLILVQKNIVISLAQLKFVIYLVQMNCMRCKKTIQDENPVHGFHSNCFETEFGLGVNHDFTHLIERRTEIAPGEQKFGHVNESFFHGKFRKYSGSLGEKNYILKVQQPDCPDLPGVEYVSNRIARLLGIKVPDHHLILFKNQAPTFVSRNIMDHASTATLDHIYKFLPESSKFNCEELSELILRETNRISEVHLFVEICLFDALIGNHDRHGRNLAFVTKGGGLRNLAPFYDNPSYIGIADELMLDSDLQPRGTIATKKTNEPSMTDYVEEFSRLGHQAIVQRFKERTVTKMSSITEIVKSMTVLGLQRISALLRLIEKRFTELENA